MKKISYEIHRFYDIGTEEEPNIVERVMQKSIPYSEDNLKLAKAEAYNGDYEIYDDGQPEPEPTPSGDDSSVWDELDAAYQEGVDSV